MINIAICDDEITVCSQLERYILQYAKEYTWDIKVEVFYTGEELCKYLDNGIYYDIIFLDIELDIMNGIEVGKKIRDEMNKEYIQIIYISAKVAYAMELFEVRPMNFLIKPLKEDKIRSILDKALCLMNKINQIFQYKQGYNIKKKEIKNIIYFKSIDKEVMMVLTEGIEYFYSSLDNIYSILEKYNFFYCHKSYLVNYIHVIDFEYDQITLSNGEILPIAQPRRKSVRKMQMELENEEI